MPTEGPSLQRPFADGLLCILVSGNAPDFPMADFADFVCKRVGGRIVNKVAARGSDEAYWDIQVGTDVVVLHYEHYMGVYLCAGSSEAEPLVERLLPSAWEYVAEMGRS